MTSELTERIPAELEDLPARTGRAHRVIVIGAGVAGLTAAYQLRRAGHVVTVLEGRLRPGGRVHSVRSPFAEGMHAEAGALFIPTDHEYLMKYIRLTGLAEELTPVRPSELGGFFYLRGERFYDAGDGPLSWSVDGDLTPTRWPGDLTATESRQSFDAMSDAYFQRIEGGVGDPEDPNWPPPHLHGLEDTNIVELLRSLGASEDAADLIRATHFAAWGDNGHTLSPLFGLQEWDDTRQIGTATTWNTIPGGNDRWAVRLAERLRENIHYGAQVVALAHDADGVAVSFLQAGRRTTLQGDFVICALPFSCLREIAVTPSWSELKHRVINEIQSTDMAHLFIQCRRPVWKRSDGRSLAAFSATDSDLTALVRDATFNQPGSRAILDLYMIGPQAERMRALDDEHRLPYALRELEPMLPGISDVAEGAVFHSWTDDPFSRGDYIFYSAGQFVELSPQVTVSEGRIHFAGDQTAAKSGWQEGAISSAHRAAREVFLAAERVATTSVGV